MASRRRGGGFDIVCWAKVGLIFPPFGSTGQGVSPSITHLRRLDTRYIPLSSLPVGSYIIVLCSRLLRSNMRTLPSWPQLTNTSTLFAQNRTSYTSLSCAINWVLAVREGISQIVHVVSILEVMMRLGETVFQSSDVNGAVWSGVFELDKSASGVSLVVAASRLRPVIELPGVDGVSEGRDHSLKWSPDVARRSVDCFVDDGGSHSNRVTG